MTETRTVEALVFEPDGRAIPYAVEGSGPAVVLIPAQGLNIGYLAALAHSVSMEDFRVARIGSRRAGGDAVASLHDLAQDVVDVMDHLGIDHAWVGGHAFGGSVARFVSLDHHDRANGVVLLGVEQADAAPVRADEIPERFLDAGVSALQRSAREAAGELPALAADVPVLIVQGTDDAITPPANGHALQSSAPGLVSVVAVEGAGHLFPATHVGATSWAIEDYLDWD
jgi:pimeloyl-ACP methyl ester carboxylesterase